jgi:ABC-type antimicrobial peptide transport system permease subunit
VSSLALLQRQASVPDQGLSLNEVWGNGPNPAPALRRRGLTTGDVFATAPILGALAQLPQSLAVGLQFTAAVAGLGLVIIGVAVGLYFAQRRRDYEFAALRAMGVRPRQVLWTLATEQASLLVFAVAIGLGVGYGILRIVMPVIGPSLSVRYPPPLLAVDELALAGALVAITVTTGVGLALATRFLVRSSVTGVLRGEAE